MTHLQFVNRAFDLCRPDVVFFHKDHAHPHGKVIAWKVIRRCPVDWSHPFRVPADLELGLVDDYGNYSPRISVRAGRSYTYIERRGQRPRWHPQAAMSATSIVVANGTKGSAIGCLLTRDGRPVIPVRRLAPGVEAVFEIGLDLWVGAVRRAREGEPLEPFDLQMSSTRLDLWGIRSGEVWMTGGGMGASAVPYSFRLCRASPG